MPEMLPCSLKCCDTPTSRRCDCCGRPFCSAACSQASWAVHRSDGAGEPAHHEGEGGDEQLTAPAPLLGEEAAPKAEGSEAAALPHAGAGEAPADGAAKQPPGGAALCAYPPCDLPRIGFCTRCLLVGWCSVAHQKAHWKAGHKAVCTPAETRLVPVLSWEQRVLAEAEAAAPASLAATAKIEPHPEWDFDRADTQRICIYIKNWRKKAASGHAKAQTDLGYCYENAIGVARDYKLAVEWYSKAAMQGYARAQYLLGQRYYCRDNKLAFLWYAKAAAQDCAVAQNMLGLLFYRGDGVAVDSTLAIEWFEKAVEQGYAPAAHNLADAYKQRLDFNHAFKWYTRAEARDEDCDAQYNLGDFCEHGKGVAQNFEAAYVWYSKAAAQGHADALYCLGRCYELGKGTTQDWTLAAHIYAKAAEKGHEKALVRAIEMRQ